MEFSFNPEEIQESMQIGKYLAKVKGFEVKTSSNGNEMIEIIFEDIRSGSLSPRTRLIATEKALFMWQNCWKSAGFKITDPNMSVEKMLEFLSDKSRNFQIEVKEKEESFYDKTEGIEKKVTKKEVYFVPFAENNLQIIEKIETSMNKINNNDISAFNKSEFENGNKIANLEDENDLPF